MADLTDVAPATSEMSELPAAPQPGNGQRPEAFLDRVLRHERGARQTFHAEWWDDEDGPCIVYYRPYTLADADEIKARQPSGPTEWLVLTVIQKAEDASGRRLFEWGHKWSLLRDVAAAHLQALSDAILGIKYPTIASAKDALTADPPLPSGSL